MSTKKKETVELTNGLESSAQNNSNKNKLRPSKSSKRSKANTASSRRLRDRFVKLLNNYAE